MPRAATGSIESYTWKDGKTVSWRLRVRCRGQRHRVDLGTNHEGWNHARAQVELDLILRQIARGTWVPPGEEDDEDGPDRRETLHLTLSRFWASRHVEWEPNTVLDYRWRADHILASDLVHVATARIDARRVDDLRVHLVGQRLAPSSVNKVLQFLAQVLDDAVDYKLLEVNPARGPRRRMKQAKPSRTFLEPDMVVDVLDVAGRWEADVPEHQRYGRRALLAALVLSGPRIAELLETPRGNLGLHAGEMRLGKKTAAGRERHLELSAYLQDELRAHVASVRRPLLDAHGARLPLFHSRPGRQLSDDNIRNRLLRGVVKRVNEQRAEAGKLLLPRTVTPHSLRRTFASLCFFAGRDLRWVMGQLGHDDARMTLAVYAQCMKRSRVDYELVWHLMRFADEPETWTSRNASRRGTFDPTNDPISSPGGPGMAR